MDSLTQIVLGASVAEATLGKKIGNKAILSGAIAGTIPDLDIILKFFVDDLSRRMHRGFSFLYCSFILTPFWFIFKRSSKIIRRKFIDWTRFFFSITILFLMHLLGQLFWPLNYRIATDNIHNRPIIYYSISYISDYLFIPKKHLKKKEILQ